MPLITLMNAHAAWGDLPLLDDADLSIEPGERVGLIGRNGTGKSTLLSILAGHTHLDDGELRVQDGLRVLYVEQEPVLPEAANVKESLILRGKLDKIEDEREHWRRLAKLDECLMKFELDPERSVARVSGGERKRAALALAFALEPDLLLLDEPTNHMDIIGKEALEQMLREYEGTVLFVSHDRYFMDKVVDHLLVFRGNADIKDFPGNYTQYREWKEVQDQLEKETEAARQARMAPTVEKTSRLEKVQKKKLTFKERKEFEALEVEIPLLEAEKAELETAMSSGTLSNDELLAKSERIAKVIEEIDEKTMRWLELSELA